jgi:hypothetical protein
LDDDIDLDTVFEDFASRNIWKRFYYELNICFKLTFIIYTIYFNLYIKKLVQWALTVSLAQGPLKL